MFNRTGILVLAIAGMLALDSCKKDGIDKTQVTFVNNLDSQVTLDIYRNADDYRNNTNVAVRKVIAAHENVVLPGNTFTSGQSYYMDWYSNDFYHNNWFNDAYPTGDVQVSFKPASGNNTYYIKPDFKGLSRSIFLGGSNSQTKWIAINAYLYVDTVYKSYWSILHASEKYQELIVNKNFVATYNHKDTAGVSKSEELNFMVHNTPNAYIEFMEDGASTGSVISGISPTAPRPNFISNSVDTVLALLPNSDYYFVMVKE